MSMANGASGPRAISSNFVMPTTPKGSFSRISCASPVLVAFMMKTTPYSSVWKSSQRDGSEPWRGPRRARRGRSPRGTPLGRIGQPDDIAARVAGRSAEQSRSGTVSEPRRSPNDQRWVRLQAPTARSRRCGYRSVGCWEARHAARAPTQLCHAHASGDWGRSQGGPLARPCQHPDHRDVSTRRPDREARASGRASSPIDHAGAVPGAIGQTDGCTRHRS
jgi:hypothetical protein